jgi:hypothetical protein
VQQLETDGVALCRKIGAGSAMNRFMVVGLGLMLLLSACGAPLDRADSTDGQSSATVAHGSADAAAEQRSLAALQKQYRFDGPTTTILSRPLTSQEVSDLPCVWNCPSQSEYYVVILEGEFLSVTRPTAVPTVVPNRPYRFVGVIFNLSSGRAMQLFGESSPSAVRAKFPDAAVD